MEEVSTKLFTCHQISDLPFGSPVVPEVYIMRAKSSRLFIEMSDSFISDLFPLNSKSLRPMISTDPLLPLVPSITIII